MANEIKATLTLSCEKDGVTISTTVNRQYDAGSPRTKCVQEFAETIDQVDLGDINISLAIVLVRLLSGSAQLYSDSGGNNILATLSDSAGDFAVVKRTGGLYAGSTDIPTPTVLEFTAFEIA